MSEEQKEIVTPNYEPGIGKVRSFVVAPEGYTSTFDFARLVGQNTEFIGKLCRDGVLRGQKMLCQPDPHSHVHHRIRTWVIANEDLDYNEGRLTKYLRGTRKNRVALKSDRLSDMAAKLDGLVAEREEMHREIEALREILKGPKPTEPTRYKDEQGRYTRLLPCDFCDPPRIVPADEMCQHLEEHAKEDDKNQAQATAPTNGTKPAPAPAPAPADTVVLDVIITEDVEVEVDLTGIIPEDKELFLRLGEIVVQLSYDGLLSYSLEVEAHEA